MILRPRKRALSPQNTRAHHRRKIIRTLTAYRHERGTMNNTIHGQDTLPTLRQCDIQLRSRRIGHLITARPEHAHYFPAQKSVPARHEYSSHTFTLNHRFINITAAQITNNHH